MNKLNQDGIAHWVVPILVVLIIAAVGTKVLLGSHADNLTSASAAVAQTTTTGALEGPYLEEVDDSSAALSNANDTAATVSDNLDFGVTDKQMVNVLQPGQTLAYRGIDTSGVGWSGIVKTVCYSLRVPYTNANNTPQVTATLELENYNNFKTVKLGSEGVYSTYCFHDNITVGPSTLQGWSLKNVSPINGPPVYISQKTVSVKYADK